MYMCACTNTHTHNPTYPAIYVSNISRAIRHCLDFKVIKTIFVKSTLLQYNTTITATLKQLKGIYCIYIIYINIIYIYINQCLYIAKCHVLRQFNRPINNIN